MGLNRILAFVCAVALACALLPLPIGYYTFLRILVTIGAVSIVFQDVNEKKRFWAILFLIVAVLFNPVVPIYLYQKSKWTWIDIGVAIAFAVYGVSAHRPRNT
ncbi:MAG: hypothetical protein EOO50_02655 [Flavobacterium sp.]|uniref:DUF6804 family protein n=1 Tax=Flavobacterium sp. TaxID=239 RepID=UPI0011F65EED|nr:DUF6804 family protein [Flavobacterium sp.]RZJ68339.1 MAG: hypothetical protein EOO50_02655 [Flavobacterium sp.]